MAESIDINSYSIIPNGSAAGVPISNAFFVAGTIPSQVINANSTAIILGGPTVGNSSLLTAPTNISGAGTYYSIILAKSGFYSINMSLVVPFDANYNAGVDTPYYTSMYVNFAGGNYVSFNAGGGGAEPNYAPTMQQILPTAGNGSNQILCTWYTTPVPSSGAAYTQLASTYTVSMVIQASAGATISYQPYVVGGGNGTYYASGNYTVQLLSPI